MLMPRLAVLLALASAVAGCASNPPVPQGATCGPRDCSIANRPARVLRHVVLFGFKEDTTADQIPQIESAFCGLTSQIDAIEGFEWGTDVSDENLAQGYTHCFLVTFGSEAARKAYLPHPAHQKFVKLLRPHAEKVLVIDYWNCP